MKDSIWNEVHFMPIMSLACNAGCAYCFGPNKGETVTPEMLQQITGFIKNVVQETGQYKVNVTFHGGEPLMAGFWLWEQVLSGIKNAFPDKKTSMNVQSNLWNLTDEICVLFREYGVSPGTSLDGPEELNDMQRGKGYFGNTMKGIRLAEKYEMKPGCICTFTPLTARHYKDIFSFFLNHRLAFSIHGSMPAVNGQISKYTLSAAAYGNLLCKLLDMYIKYRHYIQINSLDKMIVSLVEQKGQVCTFKDCLGMFLAIDPHGNIYPCQRFCGMSGYAIGNILDKPSLNDLLENPVSRKFLDRQELVREKCARCEHFPYCMGGCTYNAWSVKSDIDSYCEAYKKIFSKIRNRLLKEMSSEENIRAVAGNIVSDNRRNPLLQKGALTELTRRDTHPAKTAGNAIRIISCVEMASHSNIEPAVEMLKKKGLSITGNYLRRMKDDISVPCNRLNNLYIHITYNCQLRCSHCYATAGREKDIYMPVKTIIKMVEEARKLNFRQVVFTGGEPLTHPGLSYLLEKLISIKHQATPGRMIPPMHLVLHSNFVAYLTKTTMENIARAFTKVIVSVDGSRESHDSRRGKGTYDRTVKNLELYQHIYPSIKNAAELSLGCVLTADKVKGPEGYSVRDLASRLGISNVRFRPVLPIGRAEKWSVPPVSEAISNFYDTDDILAKGISPVNTCGIGQNLYVEPDGNAFPCYAYQQKYSYLGNAKDDGLERVLQSEKFTGLSKHTVDTNKKCRQCRYRYLCGGACRAWGGEKTKYDLDAPPPECGGLYSRAEEIYYTAINYLGKNNLIKKSEVE